MKETLLILLKIMGVALAIPSVMGLTSAAQDTLTVLDLSTRDQLLAGLATYLVLVLFVYDLQILQDLAHKVMGVVFGFFKPLAVAAPYLIPVYTLLTVIVYAVFGWTKHLDGYRPFLTGMIAFTFAMHLILSARELYEKDKGPGKPTYFLSMLLVYLWNVGLTIMLLSIIFPSVLPWSVFKAAGETSAGIYRGVAQQLF